MGKKGSMQLSINAIVVFVLAFAMLGVGIFFVNKIWVNLEDGVDVMKEIPPIIRPNAERPLIIEAVEINRKGSERIDITFYNKGNNVAENVVFKIVSCKTTLGERVDDEDVIPYISSMNTDVEPVEYVGFSTTIRNKDLDVDEYVCMLVAYDEEGSPYDDEYVYESKDFYLTITA